jgi:hypothetical protein
MSFQEDMPRLDAACKTTPWLICVGFTVAISGEYLFYRFTASSLASSVLLCKESSDL